MRIKSTQKDYYDWVAQMYGGGDPKVTLLRDRALPDPKDLRDKQELNKWFTYYEYSDVAVMSNRTGPDAPWVHIPNHMEFRLNGYVYRQERMLYIVAGKPYYARRNVMDTLTRSWALDEKGRAEREAHKAKHETQWEVFGPEGQERWIRTNAEEYGDGAYERLAKLFEAPILAVRDRWDGALEIWGQNPTLASIGMPSLVPAERMYQELSLYVGALKKEAPDATLTDVQKVEAHGFDKRQSFRHRK